MSARIAAALASALLAHAALAAPAEPDLGAARTAWRYFERNAHPQTGLVN